MFSINSIKDLPNILENPPEYASGLCKILMVFITTEKVKPKEESSFPEELEIHEMCVIL